MIIKFFLVRACHISLYFNSGNTHWCFGTSAHNNPEKYTKYQFKKALGADRLLCKQCNFYAINIYQHYFTAINYFHKKWSKSDLHEV